MTRCITNLNSAVSAVAEKDRFHSGTVIFGLWTFSVWCSINLANLWWFSERFQQVWLFIQFLKQPEPAAQQNSHQHYGPKYVQGLQSKTYNHARFEVPTGRFQFSGMWHCVVKKTAPIVSKIVIPSPLESSSLFSLNCWTLQMRALQSFKLLTTVYPTVQYPRKLESSTQYNIQWKWITVF
jgi:hypothetical protein